MNPKRAALPQQGRDPPATASTPRMSVALLCIAAPAEAWVGSSVVGHHAPAMGLASRSITRLQCAVRCGSPAYSYPVNWNSCAVAVPLIHIPFTGIRTLRLLRIPVFISLHLPRPHSFQCRHPASNTPYHLCLNDSPCPPTSPPLPPAPPSSCPFAAASFSFNTTIILFNSTSSCSAPTRPVACPSPPTPRQYGNSSGCCTSSSANRL